MKSFTLLALWLVCIPCHAQMDSLRRLDILCGNDQPLPSQFDSLQGPWPELVVSARRAVLSPDGSLLAFHLENLRDFPMEGVMIVDAGTQERRAFIPGQISSSWHPSERKLLTTHYIYDLDANEYVYLPEDPQGNSRSSWSPDGQFVYLRGSRYELGRTDSEGKNLEYLPNIHLNFIPISDTMFFSFYRENGNYLGIEFAGISGLSLRRIELQWMRDMDPNTITNINVSRDGRFVLADYFPHNSGRWEGSRFLGMLDLQTNMLKKVLPAQRLGNLYYPSMTSRGTIVVSYVCRVDSVCAVWEIDTNGVFLWQFIGKDRLRLLTTMETASAAPSDISIRSFSPHPVSGESLIEYEVASIGTYSLRLIDLSGRIVTTIVDNTLHGPGLHRAHVHTGTLPPGMYLIRLSDAQKQAVHRTIIVDR